jgi:hypothetical protein
MAHAIHESRSSAFRQVVREYWLVKKKDGVLNMVDLVPVPPPHTLPFCGHHELVLVFNLLGAFGDGRGFA